MKRQRIVLLGGGGFIGRALSNRLRERGHEIHVVSRGVALESANGTHVHGGGMENMAHLRSLLPSVDAFVHLASATTPGVSRSAPLLEASGNIAPTLAVIDELQRHPHIRCVYVSSGGTVYGNPGDSSAMESFPTQALSYYAAGKLALECFFRSLEHLSGNPVAIVRPSNIYGPLQPRYLGFGVIRTMLQHLLDDTVMEIWGDGSVVRDFLYIDDMVAALEFVIDDEAASGVFNVGSGVGCTVNQLKSLAEMAASRHLRTRHIEARSIDVQRIVLDSSKMQARYGWTPRVELAAGIRKTWEWLLNA